MRVGVLLRILVVIFVIRAGGVRRLPAGIGLREVRDYRPIAGGNVLIDGLEGRVIGQHIFPCLRLHLHAHDLVNLHRDGSRREVGIEVADRALGESRLFEFVRAEGRAHNGTATRAVDDLEHVTALRLHSLGVRVAIVNYEDVQDAQVQALHQGAERRVVLVKVRVRVNRRHGGKTRDITGLRPGGLGFGHSLRAQHRGEHHQGRRYSRRQ